MKTMITTNIIATKNKDVENRKSHRKKEIAKYNKRRTFEKNQKNY